MIPSEFMTYKWIPSEFMTYKWMTRRFGEQINMIKHKMRGGYKKRGNK